MEQEDTSKGDSYQGKQSIGLNETMSGVSLYPFPNVGGETTGKTHQLHTFQRYPSYCLIQDAGQAISLI